MQAHEALFCSYVAIGWAQRPACQVAKARRPPRAGPATAQILTSVKEVGEIVDHVRQALREAHATSRRRNAVYALEWMAARWAAPRPSAGRALCHFMPGRDFEPQRRPDGQPIIDVPHRHQCRRRHGQRWRPVVRALAYTACTKLHRFQCYPLVRASFNPFRFRPAMEPSSAVYLGLK